MNPKSLVPGDSFLRVIRDLTGSSMIMRRMPESERWRHGFIKLWKASLEKSLGLTAR